MVQMPPSMKDKANQLEDVLAFVRKEDGTMVPVRILGRDEATNMVEVEGLYYISATPRELVRSDTVYLVEFYPGMIHDLLELKEISKIKVGQEVMAEEGLP